MSASPPPYKTPMIDQNGFITLQWAAYFRGVSDTGSTTVESVADHVADTTAHAAASITNSPSGHLAATNVQAALNELQTSIDDLGALEGPSAYEVAVSNGFVGSESAWLLSLVGATGSTGATGGTGPQGVQGVQGPTGPAGGAVNTQFAVNSTGYIYANSLTGHVYCLEVAT